MIVGVSSGTLERVPEPIVGRMFDSGTATLSSGLERGIRTNGGSARVELAQQITASAAAARRLGQGSRTRDSRNKEVTPIRQDSGGRVSIKAAGGSQERNSGVLVGLMRVAVRLSFEGVVSIGPSTLKPEHERAE